MAKINNNVQNVLFLRNGLLYTTRDAARQALEDNKTLGGDGSAILARYGEGEEVKTLVGFIWSDGTDTTVTIFDIDDAGADVKEYIQSLLGEGVTSANTVTDQLEALSGSTASTSADTSVAGAKAYTDDKIDELVDGLEYTGVTTGAGVVVTNVTESDGVVSATSANVGTLELTGYVKGSDSGAVASTDTVNAAISKLENQVDAEKAAIEALDLAVVSGDGEVIVAVSQENGQVAAEKAAIKDVKLTGYENNSGATGAIAATDDIEDALSKLENNIAAAQSATTVASADGSINVTTASTGTDINVNIKSGEHVLAKDGNAGIYTDLDLVKITTGLPETIKERYQLLATDDSQIGTNIDIPKDSHIVSINYITDSGDTHYQNLEYVYITDSGTTSTTYVDMSELVLEAEFASGVTVTNGVAHGVVDPTSESFLTVGADGFKLSGVSGLVENAVADLDANVSGNSTHVTVGVEEVDGVITAVTVAEDNIANADDLAELSGKTVTAITSTNGSITASIDDAVGNKTYDLATDASKIQMSGFTAAESGFTAISGNSSVTDAVKAIETAFIDNEQVVSAALNDLEATKLENIIVNDVTGTVANNVASVTIDGGDVQLTGYESGNTGTTIEATDTVNEAISKLENQIASLGSGSTANLDAEIAERRAIEGQSGQTYAPNTASTYISGATSLNDADVKLDAAIDEIADNYISGITVNGSAVTVSNNIAPIVIDSATSATTATSTEAITVDTDADGNITLGLATIDCGFYA